MARIMLCILLVFVLLLEQPQLTKGPASLNDRFLLP